MQTSPRHFRREIMAAAATLSMALISNQLSPSAAAQLCTNEQSTLEVILSNRSQAWYNLFIQIEQVALDTNNIKGTSFSSNHNPITPNITICIPQNECTRVRVEGLSKNVIVERESSFAIRQDGNEVPLGKFFQSGSFDAYNDTFVTTTFVGNCTPTCGINESLMELEVFTGDSYNRIEDVQWIVQDASGEVLAQCNRYHSDDEEDCYWRGSYRSYNTKICLPTDGCYQLVVGSERKNYDIVEARAEWSGTFGGTEILTFQGEDVHFASIEFGSNCETCGENEDWLQIFMFQNLDYFRRTITWSIVNVVDTETIMSAVLPGVKFNYKRECVSLSDTCAKYTVTTDCSFSKDNIFHLEWGGFVYDPDSIYDADYPGRDDDDKPREIFLGSCNVEERNPCNSATDSLFELTLEMEPGFCRSPGWTITEYPNGNGNTRGGGTSDVPVGTTYKIFRCLPIKSKDVCSVEFRMSIDYADYFESDAVAEYTSYSVSLDGIAARKGRQQRSSYDSGSGCSRYQIVTLLVSRCWSLSRKEKEGIVIGSIIGFVMLLNVGYIYMVYIKRRESTDAGA